MNFYEELNPDIIYFMHSSKKHKWRTHEIIDFYSLVFVLDGGVKYIIEGEDYEAEQGDVVFIPPGKERTAWTSDMHYVAIDFILDNEVEFPFQTVMKIPQINSYIKYFEEFNTEWLQQGFEYKLKCKGLLLLILHKLIAEKNNQASNKNVEQIKAYISQNYYKPITLEHIADTISLSPVYCGAIFKKHESYSVSYYINKIRVNQSIMLMQKSSLNISEIAFQIGYNDTYYFSKVFKKMTGMTPSNYRKYCYSTL